MGRWEGLEEQQRGLRDRGLQTLQAPHPWCWRSTAPPPTPQCRKRLFPSPSPGKWWGQGANVERESSPSIQCFGIEAEVLESLSQREGNSWVLLASELSLFWRVGNSRRRLKGLLPETGQSPRGELGPNLTGPCPCSSNSPFCCCPCHSGGLISAIAPPPCFSSPFFMPPSCLCLFWPWGYPLLFSSPGDKSRESIPLYHDLSVSLCPLAKSPSVRPDALHPGIQAYPPDQQVCCFLNIWFM